MNLTTLDKVKQFYGIKTTCNDALITVLIAQASAAIENYLGRNLELAFYTEKHEGNGRNQLLLKNWPVKRIYNVGSGYSNAIEVTYTGTSTGRIEVNNDGVVLIAGLTDTELTFAANATIGDMATAINGEADWTGTADSAESGKPSRFLLPVNAADIDTNGEWLSVPTSETHVTLETERMIHKLYPFACGRNYSVVYKAGYETDLSDLPADLCMVANQVVGDILQSAENSGNYKSETIGDYKYEIADVESAVSTYSQQLSTYKSLGL